MKSPLVKICGITRLEDAFSAAGAGADFLGFIFYKKSPRYILPADAGVIVQKARSDYPTLRFVGVFVNAASDEIIETVKTARLSLVQLHGDETPEDVEVLRRLLDSEGLSDVKIIKAFRVRGPEDLRYSLEYRTDYLLFDAFVEGEMGGTGHVFNWKLLEGFPKMDILFLSGGISAENVRDALEKTAPMGVDLSSSVEKAKGIKDPDKIEEFMKAVKSRG